MSDDLTMTFDELHTELLKHSLSCRLFPKCSREALRAVLHEWSPLASDARLPAKVSRRLRLIAPGRGFGSIWITITIELLKVIIPWLIEWWQNRDDGMKLLSALIAEERAMTP